MPLDALKKQYAGAYVGSFEWPQPSDEDDAVETEGQLKIILKIMIIHMPLFHWFSICE